MLMEILVLLSEHPGSVVSREEVLERVWDNRLVSDSTLSRDIAVLRRHLEDDARKPTYIQTISKRGFRLVAPVTAMETGNHVRIGVLPFENLNHDTASDYLADGFADALTTELARLPGLRVISRQSMLQFQGSSRGISEIASELRASVLVEGSLVRIEDRIRINAQLLEGPTDQHLWADTYEGENALTLSNLCSVARRFAHSIQAILAPDSVVSPTPAPHVIAAANVEYLKARYYFVKWTQEGVQKGIAHLQQALEIDPTHGQAYAGLAWCLAILGYWGFMPIEDAYPKAKAAALQAIALEPSSEAHAALALVKWLYDWDISGTKAEILRALEMDPSNEHAHFLHGLFLATMERDHDGAVEEARLTLDLDPLSPVSNFSAAWVLLFAGELGQAAERARRTLALYPDSPAATTALGWAEMGLGRLSEGSAAFERAAALEPGAITMTYAAFGLGRTGHREEALELLKRLTCGTGNGLPAFAQAMIHVGVGDCDRALACMEQCLTNRDSRIFWFPVVPGLDALRAHPRFPDFMSRVAAACRG